MVNFYPTPNNVIKHTTGYTAGSGSLALQSGDGAAFGAVFPLVFSTFLADLTPCGVYSCTGRSTDTLTGLTLLSGTDATLPAGSIVAIVPADEHFAQLRTAVTASLVAAANLADLASAATARTNLGLGTIATHAATDYLAPGGSGSALTGITESQVGGLVSDLTTLSTAVGLRALDSAVVHTTGTESVAGAKTFTTAPVLGSLTGVLKASTGTLAAAAAGTDYLAPSGDGSGLTGLTEGQISGLTADLAAKAPFASPALTGTPTAPTASPGTNTTQLATTAFVQAVGGSRGLFDHYASAGNSGTGETDLYSDSIAAGRLGANGDKIIANFGLTLVNSTSTKQVKVYFAGTVLFDTGALTVSASGDLAIHILIIRDTSASVRYSITASSTGASTGAYANVGALTGLTLSGANVLKVTGTASGLAAASNDLVAVCGAVRFEPAV